MEDSVQRHLWIQVAVGKKQINYNVGGLLPSWPLCECRSIWLATVGSKTLDKMASQSLLCSVRYFVHNLKSFNWDGWAGVTSPSFLQKIIQGCLKPNDNEKWQLFNHVLISPIYLKDLISQACFRNFTSKRFGLDEGIGRGWELGRFHSRSLTNWPFSERLSPQLCRVQYWNKWTLFSWKLSTLVFSWFGSMETMRKAQPPLVTDTTSDAQCLEKQFNPWLAWVCEPCTVTLPLV